MKNGDWARLLLLGALLWFVAKPKRETIPSWGDASNTG